MAKKKTAATSPTFETALAKLEQMVAQLEDGDTGLEEALAAYEQGVGHLRHCYDLLEKAERKIELLSGFDADGNPITEPYDAAEDSSLEDKAGRRSGRRTSRSRKNSVEPDDEVDAGDTLF